MAKFVLNMPFNVQARSGKEPIFILKMIFAEDATPLVKAILI